VRRTLLIAAGPGEWRAAWLEGGMVTELHTERGDIRPAGSMQLGRVVRRVAGLDAALVDIGEARPGFLPLRSGVARGLRIDEGASVVVQIRREAQRGKGALLAAMPEQPTAGLEPPMRLDPPPGFAAALALRLPGMPDEVIADDPATFPELRTVFGAAEVAQLPPNDWPADLDRAFEAALMSSLALPEGGSLHIDEGRAAVLIDVDTGSPETGSAERTAMSANLAAATAIARQLRLRQLGGGIVVDFAALEGRRAREQVGRAMTAALAGDPAGPHLLGWTRLGHLELVRPRRLRSLAEAMLDPDTGRPSALTLAYEVLRALLREARARPAAAWRIVAAAPVAAALLGPAAAALHALEIRLGRDVPVESRAEIALPAFDILAR
jgi:Ribonuclease G/E